MAVLKQVGLPTAAVILLCAGCATSPEEESRRQAIETEIGMILAHPLDPSVYGETKRCLGDNEYRSYRRLDDRRMLFEGRNDKLWVNTLRTNCPDLRRDGVLVVRSFTARRICDGDNFSVSEWFDWPWYRRWPWHWGSWNTGMTCVFGEFQPVTEDQVAEIDLLLDSR
ncbi:MAG: DUF6491 family protein [Gammaproteobacteria bacterium]|nr:DUF6491 family protein [Gammaproteobacteria bacterium]MDH4313497.1 DUF6491 family protein [Gammaproteobacteria bacterium]MDH5213877.1 DUF6491 family protein [Gammaproteobacteria bacterium]MDH5501707.1 DUF6491 family protein [Gammaproteobacteria bacterium]